MTTAAKTADIPKAEPCAPLPIPTDRENCFTLFRYIFALAIFVHHLYRVKGGDGFGFHTMVFIQAFFIMSGYLNINSYARHPDWRSFARKRIRRILPAYFLTILFCFIVGMGFTTLPLADFLTAPQTWKYLLCNLVFLNFLEPGLPGVFADHLFPVMDASLWTMKVEVMYYMTVPLVWWMMRRWGTTKVLSLIVVLSMGYSIATRELYEATHLPLFNALNHQIVGELALFYFPALLLYYRSWLQRWQFPLALLATLLFLLSFVNFRWGALAPVTLSILLVVLGHGLEPWLRTSRWHNITYEFYLLHFPVLQIFIDISPSMSIIRLAAMAFVTTVALACILNVFVSRLLNKS